MCGRATLSSPAEDVARLFEAPPIEIGPARFNIAPTQPILTVRAAAASAEAAARSPAGSSRELVMVRWGLVPWWAKPDEAKKVASRCVQARAESAPRAPAFRDAFKRHRCLVVVDGFYEWKTLADGRRVPHHVRRSHREPFAIAAVWDSWRPPAPSEGVKVESCAVLTTPAAGPMKELHDRMPLVLPANEWDTWLGGSPEQAAQLLEDEPHETLLGGRRGAAEGGTRDVLDRRARELVVIPVSSWVNDVRHDDPRCIEPAPIEAPPGQISFAFAPGSRARSARGRP